MKSLTEYLHNFLPYWQEIIPNKENAYRMAQIEAILTKKYITGKYLAEELNISFMPEGYSHILLIDQDEEVFSKYFRPEHDYWNKLIHIETVMELFERKYK